MFEGIADHPVSRVADLLPWNTVDIHPRLDQRLAAWTHSLSIAVVGTGLALTQPKKFSEKKPATRLQNGALTYRKTSRNGIEILLLTSRETKRWIIPKGWPIKGMKPCESAAQKAYDEAGVRGTIDRRPIGKYTYDKRLEPPAKVVPCEVQVYALRVRRQEETWPENGQRELRWCPPDEAITIVDDVDLGTLIGKFVAQDTK